MLKSTQDIQKRVHASITSMVDYCNDLLKGLPKKPLRQPQVVQNKVLTKTKEYEHIQLILKLLHLHPVCQIIDFKIMLLPYVSQHGLGPENITDMLLLHKPLDH